VFCQVSDTFGPHYMYFLTNDTQGIIDNATYCVFYM